MLFNSCYIVGDHTFYALYNYCESSRKMCPYKYNFNVLQSIKINEFSGQISIFLLYISVHVEQTYSSFQYIFLRTNYVMFLHTTIQNSTS